MDIWVHEYMRIFNDRLISQGDREMLQRLLMQTTKVMLPFEPLSSKQVENLIFSDLTNEEGEYMKLENS